MSPAQLLIAIVFNLVIFPGSGQFFLKEKRRGLRFLLLAIFVLGAILIHFMTLVHDALLSPEFLKDLALLQQGGGKIDPQALLRLTEPLTESLVSAHDLTFRIYLFILLVLYVAVTIDLIFIYLDRKAAK